jgi:hypothetical protein
MNNFFPIFFFVCLHNGVNLIWCPKMFIQHKAWNCFLVFFLGAMELTFDAWKSIWHWMKFLFYFLFFFTWWNQPLVFDIAHLAPSGQCFLLFE